MASQNDTLRIHGDDDDSTAQVLASGSQDIAALAGLFVTDGVERNALATEYGYTTVISSCLSILGVLGLVKSSIKLALGLRQCISSGWNPDSLRGIFGYTLDESPRSAGETINCLRVSVKRTKTDWVIEKERQRFDSDKVPMLGGAQKERKRFRSDHVANLGGQNEAMKNDEGYVPCTVINLGNKVREIEITQSPLIISILLFLCSGLTSWVLLIVSLGQKGRWHWTVLFGVLGLHISMIVMLSPPLWHAYRTCRPSCYATGQVWDVLLGRIKAPEDLPSNFKFSFLRTCRVTQMGVHQILHFRGDVSYLDQVWFKVLMIVISAVCTVSYVCQYAVLKGAGSTEAAVWIGVQAGFALLRVIIWVFDPPFDDPRSTQAEFLTIPNFLLPEFCLLKTLTDLMGDGDEDFVNTNLDPLKRTIKMPLWAWSFLQNHNLGEVLELSKRSSDRKILEVVPRLEGSPTEIHIDGYSSSIFVFEHGVQRMLGERWRTSKRLGADDLYDDIALFNLRLVLARVGPPGEAWTEPVLLIHTEDPMGMESHTVPEETSLRFDRFGGLLQGPWTEIPTQATVANMQNQLSSLKDNARWEAACVGLKELGEKDDGVASYIQQDWTQYGGMSLQSDLLEQLQKFYTFSFDRLSRSPGEMSTTMSHFFIDHRSLPLARTWCLWKFLKFGAKADLSMRSESILDWYRISFENFEKPRRELKSKTFYWIRCNSFDEAMHWISQYMEHDEDARRVRLLKQVFRFCRPFPRLRDYFLHKLIERFEDEPWKDRLPPVADVGECSWYDEDWEM